MLKKTIAYTDLDGNPAEEDAYFNLTEAEAIELNIRNDLEVIGRSKNGNEIMDTFKRIIKMSYGVRTGDGKFIKEERDFNVFVASEAYSKLFMEIWKDPTYASTFIKGILPAGIIGDGEPENQSVIPEHMRNHPSMRGHLAEQPQTRRDAREKPSETEGTGFGSFVESRAAFEEEMRNRIRAELEAEYRAQNVPQVPQAPVSTTPEASQDQNPPPRESLI